MTDEQNKDNQNKPISLVQEKRTKLERELSALSRAIDRTRSMMPVLKEFYELQAQQKKVKYDQYINADFTPQQALELCKHDQ